MIRIVSSLLVAGGLLAPFATSEPQDVPSPAPPPAPAKAPAAAPPQEPAPPPAPDAGVHRRIEELNARLSGGVDALERQLARLEVEAAANAARAAGEHASAARRRAEQDLVHLQRDLEAQQLRAVDGVAAYELALEAARAEALGSDARNEVLRAIEREIGARVQAGSIEVHGDPLRAIERGLAQAPERLRAEALAAEEKVLATLERARAAERARDAERRIEGLRSAPARSDEPLEDGVIRIRIEGLEKGPKHIQLDIEDLIGAGGEWRALSDVRVDTQGAWENALTWTPADDGAFTTTLEAWDLEDGDWSELSPFGVWQASGVDEHEHDHGHEHDADEETDEQEEETGRWYTLRRGDDGRRVILRSRDGTETELETDVIELEDVDVHFQGLGEQESGAYRLRVGDDSQSIYGAFGGGQRRARELRPDGRVRVFGLQSEEEEDDEVEEIEGDDRVRTRRFSIGGTGGVRVAPRAPAPLRHGHAVEDEDEHEHGDAHAGGGFFVHRGQGSSGGGQLHEAFPAPRAPVPPGHLFEEPEAHAPRAPRSFVWRQGDAPAEPNLLRLRAPRERAAGDDAVRELGALIEELRAEIEALRGAVRELRGEVHSIRRGGAR